MHPPEIGCDKSEVDTPALCIDIDVMDANIASMAAACRERALNWRPHVKCHKSVQIAHRLVEAGAMGVTCAKLSEAEVMAAGGVTDILIANMFAGREKIERLLHLRTMADVIICVDHIDQARPVSEAMAAAGLSVRVLIEVEIGMKRVGVAAGKPLLELARQVQELPGLRLTGVMGYEGHLLRLKDGPRKRERIHKALGTLSAQSELLRKNGLPCPIVSCGGTGSFKYAVDTPGITEIQAGGGILMDAFYRHGCHVDQWQHALTIVSTVVSRPAADRAVIDAGRKTVDGSLHMPVVPGRDDIQFKGLSAEHGILQLKPSAQNLAIGDRLEFIPGYSDWTCVLHDYFLAFRGENLEAVWPLDARGCLQ